MKWIMETVCGDVLEDMSPEDWAPGPQGHQWVQEEPAGGTEDRADVRGQDPIETYWDLKGWKDIQVCC